MQECNSAKNILVGLYNELFNCFLQEINLYHTFNQHPAMTDKMDQSEAIETNEARVAETNQEPKDVESEVSKKRKTHRLKQRFQVVRKLGQGTYGKVQLAINNETGQEVSLITF